MKIAACFVVIALFCQPLIAQDFFKKERKGCLEKAEALKPRFWGGMVEKGADTFWQVYDPEDDFVSPYRFFPINSYCHAWSCTPVYFIRKYPEVFQK